MVITNIAEIKEATDIVELIASFVKLHRKGRYHYGLCPFHNEHTASFVVSTARQKFRCYGCDVRGDAIDFVMKHKELGFEAAVQWLASDNGLMVEYAEKLEEAKQQQQNERTVPLTEVKDKKDKSYIPIAIMTDSLKNPNDNSLAIFLQMRFGTALTMQLVDKYKIGTVQDSTIFWYIDIQGFTRAGKIIPYDRHTGKRIKEKGAGWVHANPSFLLPNTYTFNQCLFGEHLLHGSNKTIAIVESEKSAILCSIYYPEFTWLATGGKQNLRIELCEALAGKNVILYPDLNAHDEWCDQAIRISTIANRVLVSKYLQGRAAVEDKQKGLDLADYLLRYDHALFNPKH